MSEAYDVAVLDADRGKMVLCTLVIDDTSSPEVSRLTYVRDITTIEAGMLPSPEWVVYALQNPEKYPGASRP